MLATLGLRHPAPPPSTFHYRKLSLARSESRGRIDWQAGPNGFRPTPFVVGRPGKPDRPL